MVLLKAVLLTLFLLLGAMAQSAGGLREQEDISALRAAAERGDPQKQSELARRYDLGKGVSKDHGEAMTWYRKAAEQGDARRQQTLGFLL